MLGFISSRAVCHNYMLKPGNWVEAYSCGWSWHHHLLRFSIYMKTEVGGSLWTRITKHVLLGVHGWREKLAVYYIWQNWRTGQFLSLYEWKKAKAVQLQCYQTCYEEQLCRKKTTYDDGTWTTILLSSWKTSSLLSILLKMNEYDVNFGTSYTITVWFRDWQTRCKKGYQCFKEKLVGHSLHIFPLN